MSSNTIRLQWLIPVVVLSSLACSSVDDAEYKTVDVPSSPIRQDASPKTPDAGSTPQVLDAALSDAPQPNTDASGSDGSSVTEDASSTDASTTSAAVCGPYNTCAAPFELPSISGDDHSEWTGAAGSETAWLKVRLREDEHGLSAKPLKAQLWLEQPANAIFDLYVYDGCGSQIASGIDAAKSNVINLEFPDNKSLSGSDDSKDLYVEVRYRSGLCSSESAWTMYIVGNR